jgi:cobalt/nickel transport system permease protein
MNVRNLIGHSRERGALHSVPAGWKMAGALALVLTVVLLPRSQGIGLAGVAIVLGGLVAASGIRLWFLLKRMLLLEPLVLGISALMLFQPGGGRIFALVILKANLCLLTTVLLANTTPFTGQVRVLQRLRVPWLFVTTLSLMHRYLFVLADEVDRMRRARACRTFTRERRFQWQALATVVGQLFVRASERAERVYDAMCARGWK